MLLAPSDSRSPVYGVPFGEALTNNYEAHEAGLRCDVPVKNGKEKPESPWEAHINSLGFWGKF